MILANVQSDDEELAEVVREGLRTAGHQIQTYRTPWVALITVTTTTGPHVELDSVDGPFEHNLLKALEQFSQTGAILLKRRGGIRRDRHCTLAIPSGDLTHVVRAISWALHQTRPLQLSWFQRLFPSGVS